VWRVRRILLVSGGTRAGSTNSAAMRAAASMELPGITTRMCAGLTALPHFNVEMSDKPVAWLNAHVVEPADVLSGTSRCLRALAA
jgi:hypothetical protein